MSPGNHTTTMNLFKRITAEKLIADQLYEARRSKVEHEEAAEHHNALAVMYGNRIRRLEGKTGQVNMDPPRDGKMPA